MSKPLHVDHLPGEYAISQLPPGTPYDGPAGRFWSAIETPDEITVVCETAHQPKDAIAADDGWALLRLEGPFDLTLFGIVIQVLVPFAEAEVEVYTLSTYDTDYLLVRMGRLAAAKAAIVDAGHTFAHAEWDQVVR